MVINLPQLIKEVVQKIRTKILKIYDIIFVNKLGDERSYQLKKYALAEKVKITLAVIKGELSLANNWHY